MSSLIVVVIMKNHSMRCYTAKKSSNLNDMILRNTNQPEGNAVNQTLQPLTCQRSHYLKTSSPSSKPIMAIHNILH
ncbi:hypothetical protein L1887_10217 [Cichorium endivia]|nr:hypothetical protein L1887_10217 [Cichorium endivia]